MAEQPKPSPPVHVLTTISADIKKILLWQESFTKKYEADQNDMKTLLAAMNEKIAQQKAKATLQRKGDKAGQPKAPVEKKEPPTGPMWFAELYTKNAEEVIEKYKIQNIVDQSKKEVAQSPKCKNMSGARLVGIEATLIFNKIFKENGETKKAMIADYNVYKKEYEEIEKKKEEEAKDAPPNEKKEVPKKEEKKEEKKEDEEEPKEEEKEEPKEKKEEPKEKKEEPKKKPVARGKK